jgi:hypothetical protein
MLSIAKSYINSGYLPIPISLTKKAPVLKEWPSLRITEQNVAEYFTAQESNLGILLGVGEEPIADVDCDCPEAIIAAEHLLPNTAAVFGRESSLRSHYLYTLEGPVPTKQFKDPLAEKTKAMLVELRCAKTGGDGGIQTVVPPSIHPSGERVKWEGTDQLPADIPEPSSVSADSLKIAVSRVAAAALLARYWPKAGQGRHNAMLALAGVLARSEWLEDDALAFCDAVYRSVEVPDLTKLDRVQSEVHSTFKTCARGENTTGLTTLKGMMNERAVVKAIGWLDIASKSEPTVESDGRPLIQLKNSSFDTKTDQCIAVLKATNQPPSLFFRRGELVSLQPAGKDSFSIRDVTEPFLSSLLSRKAIFLKANEKTDPSERVTRNVLINLSESESFPPLDGIVTAPVIRSDGTILDTPGYDRASKLYYAPAHGLSVPKVPERPSEEEVRAALSVLEDVIADFPFEDESSKANALAALLTPIVRPAIQGPTPLALFDATAAGTGKTLLAEVVSLIATGSESAMMTAPKNRDEWRKKITAVLRAAHPIVVWDNVSAKLDADELMSVLSAESWSDRLLGQSLEITLPNRCSWIATANNIQLEGQMVRRSYWVRMDAKMARPFTRSQFKYPSLKRHVKKQRGSLLAALLTLARAWFANGMKPPAVKPLGSFESWTIVIGGILENAGINAFLGNNAKLHAHSDDETQLWESLLTQLFTVFNGQRFTTASMLEKTKQYAELEETIDLIFGDAVSNERVFKQQVAKRFKARLGTHFADNDGREVWLEQDGTISRIARWIVRSKQSLKMRATAKQIGEEEPQQSAA